MISITRPDRGAIALATLLCGALTAASPSFAQTPTPPPASAAAAFAAAPLTARQLIERIQQQVGVPWTSPTVDTFKAGDPETRVTGVAVTMMATLDVLQRAAAAKQNLIITHEPTFFGHTDETAGIAQENDAVLAAKQAFIKEHGLVVWRFHDFWHRRQPDGVMTGTAQALGWQAFQDKESPALFRVPATSLDALAGDLQKKLQAAVVRVVGDPKLRVTNVALAPGASGFARHRKLLQRDEVQVLVIGEAQEWETVEYVADAISAGKAKALIMLGHIPSEQAGMEECARWLKTFVREVPIAFVPARDPFWRPGAAR